MPCRARECREAHHQHYCWICDNPDSDHLARHCPGRHACTLYHATRISSLEGIGNRDASTAGLRPSTKSGLNLGPGIYFTHKPETVLGLAEVIAGGTATVVFKCTVNLGEVKNLDSAQDLVGNWRQEGFDSAVRMHGPWGKVGSFREYCVKSPHQVKITDVYLHNGTLGGEIYFPDSNIHFSGNCTLTGTLSGGNVIFGSKLNI